MGNRKYIKLSFQVDYDKKDISVIEEYITTLLESNDLIKVSDLKGTSRLMPNVGSSWKYRKSPIYNINAKGIEIKDEQTS